jgi:hypothetical protein
MMKRTLYFGFAGGEDEVFAVLTVSEKINDAAHRNEKPIVTNDRLMRPFIRISSFADKSDLQ